MAFTSRFSPMDKPSTRRTLAALRWFRAPVIAIVFFVGLWWFTR